VVGRSGSGKSTLAAALFRILELEEGAIRVGGDDVRGLGLARLRGAPDLGPDLLSFGRHRTPSWGSLGRLFIPASAERPV
jgi:energy-coupling factor transporter ATP-binding protein EcfA2